MEFYKFCPLFSVFLFFYVFFHNIFSIRIPHDESNLLKNLWNATLILTGIYWFNCFFGLFSLNEHWFEIYRQNNSREQTIQKQNAIILIFFIIFSILRFLNVFNVIFSLLQDFRKWLHPCKIFQVHYSSMLACLLLTSATGEIFASSFLPWNCYLKQSHTLNSFSA